MLQVKETEEAPPPISESDDEEKIQTEARILSEQIRSLQQEKCVFSSELKLLHLLMLLENVFRERYIGPGHRLVKRRLQRHDTLLLDSFS